MKIYRWEGRGFRSLELHNFDAERDLENLLEQDATPVLDEKIFLIGRQTSIGASRKPDLLALDQDGNCVLFELKRGKARRSVIAQLLEYAAVISKFSFSEIENLAEIWCASQGREFDPLLKMHSDFFGYELGRLKRSAFNKKVRLVLFSEGISPVVLSIAEFLRSNQIDLTYISYKAYDSIDEVLVTTQKVVGKLTLAEPSRSTYRVVPLLTKKRFLSILRSNCELCQIARNFFDYIESCGSVLRPRRTLIRTTIGGQSWMSSYPSRRASHFRINLHGDFTSKQIAIARSNLPDLTRKTYGISFNIVGEIELNFAIEMFERIRHTILEV